MYPSIFSNDGVLALQSNDTLLNKPYSSKQYNSSIEKKLKVQSSAYEDRSKTNLIINYLPQSYTQEDLQRLFEQIGPIRQCKLVKDKLTGTSLCYGFVDFVDSQHATIAIQTYHGYETEQKRLRVAYASSGNKKQNENSIGNHLSSLEINDLIGWEVSVSGIPPDKTEQDLCKMFNNFGKVLSVKIITKFRENHQKPESDLDSLDYTNLSKNILMARIVLEDRMAAESAVHCLHGICIAESRYILSVCIIGSVSRESLFTRNNSRESHDSNGFDFTSLNEMSNDVMKVHNPIMANNSKGIPFQQTNQASSISNQRPIMRNNKCEIGPKVLVNCQYNDSFPLHFPSYPTSSGINPAPGVTSNNHLSHTTAQQLSQPFPQQPPQQPASSTNHNSRSSKLIHSSQNCGNLLPSPCDNLLMKSNGLGMKKLSNRTQLIYSNPLSNHLKSRGIRAQVYLKLENLQPTGSFKIRGLESLFHKMSQKNKQTNLHIVCPCPGLNNAITCVYCAQAYQISCTLVIPQQIEAMLRKQVNTFLNIDLDSSPMTIIASGHNYNDCVCKAQSLIQEYQTNNNNNNLCEKSLSKDLPIEYRLVNIVDSPEVYSAYDGIVDEIVADLNNEVPNVIVLPIGSGSLTAGIIQGLWNHNLSDVKIVTMEADNSQSLLANQKTHSPVTMSCPTADMTQHSCITRNIISSLTCAPLSMDTLQKVLYHPITCFTCSDADALDCVKRFLQDHCMLVEPAAGVALSAVYHDSLVKMFNQSLLPNNANVVMIVTGGRDVSFDQILEWEQIVSYNAARNDVLKNVSSTKAEKMMVKNNIYDTIQSNEMNSLTTVNSVVDSLFSTNNQHKSDDLAYESSGTENGSDSGLVDSDMVFKSNSILTSCLNDIKCNMNGQPLPIGHNRPQLLRPSHHHQHHQPDLSDGTYEINNTLYNSKMKLCNSSNNMIGASSPLSLLTAASSIDSNIINHSCASSSSASSSISSSSSASNKHSPEQTNTSFPDDTIDKFINLQSLIETN